MNLPVNIPLLLVILLMIFDPSLAKAALVGANTVKLLPAQKENHLIVTTV